MKFYRDILNGTIDPKKLKIFCWNCNWKVHKQDKPIAKLRLDAMDEVSRAHNVKTRKCMRCGCIVLKILVIGGVGCAVHQSYDRGYKRTTGALRKYNGSVKRKQRKKKNHD